MQEFSQIYPKERQGKFVLKDQLRYNFIRLRFILIIHVGALLTHLNYSPAGY
jgi:hypothetical protein